MFSSNDATKPKAKVLVGTPCYGGMCFVGYVASLLSAKEYLKTKNIQLETCFLTNESLIPRGRNTIVAKFMTDPTFTHLLFIDGDITYNHRSIEQLINHDKDLVGALYPKKGYDWKKLRYCVEDIQSDAFMQDKGETLNKIRAKMMNYTINYTESRQVRNGLLSVKHIGTGFFLVKREVIQKMMDHYTELKYDDDINILKDAENKFLYALFDCEVHQLGQRRHYLSEDYLFCKRWQDMGGEIFADITIPLTHTGTHSFNGNYLSSINFERTATTSTTSTTSKATTPVIKKELKKATETKATETKATETKATETKATETKATETKATETKTDEVQMKIGVTKRQRRKPKDMKKIEIVD